jgi:hypothetical protein
MLTVPRALLLDFGGVLVDAPSQPPAPLDLVQRLHSLVSGTVSVEQISADLVQGAQTYAAWRDGVSADRRPTELSHERVWTEFIACRWPESARATVRREASALSYAWTWRPEWQARRGIRVPLGRRITLAETDPRVGSHWTNDGRPNERRGLKHRARSETRSVPIPPQLVALLHRHIEKHDTAPDGRLFRGLHGGPLSSSVYDRWWKMAREVALTPAQAASPLARRPYDLRHAAASLWLKCPRVIPLREHDGNGEILTTQPRKNPQVRAYTAGKIVSRL